MGTSEIMVRGRHTPLFVQHTLERIRMTLSGAKVALDTDHASKNCNSKNTAKTDIQENLVNCCCHGETSHFQWNYTSSLLLSFIPKIRSVIVKAVQWKEMFVLISP